ncbi:MAG: glycosyltransferase family 4 protein [Nitrosopumilus sp.]|nr:glycosyltransferase family 4 protein [Nitrosopumilus sp.]
MQILFMVFHFPPISGGGVVVIVELANKFAELGHEVTVLTPDLEWNGEKYEPDIHKKILVHKVSTPSKSNLKIAARMCYDNMKKKGIELGKQNNYDFILSIFHPFHLVPKAAVSCGKKLKKPVLIKIDDAIYEKAKGLKNIQRKIEKVYNSRTLRNADKLLVANDSTKELINNYYKISKEKISIVTNGTDLKKFYNSKERKKRIVFSGVMYNHRGIDILLDSVQKVVKKIPDVEFLLLGDGPEMQKLQDIVKENHLTENVIFKGWVDRDEIPEFLANSSIGIGPLRSTDVTKGALPIKVLEYMASSLPILAINGTLPEDVLKNGFNGYSIENSKELSDRIIHLLENETVMNDMAQNSREMVKKFDWKNIAESIINEYKIISSLSK